jgi:serine/threonine protein kinase/formylglycine-generating enzyme required for sulfatase activity
MIHAADRPLPLEFDGYRILKALGRGGMGEVFLAHDTVLERPVAVKFIAMGDADPRTRERFLLEARAAARIQHPNVMTVHRVGETGGRPYIVCEFVEGRALDVMPHPIEWRQVLEIALGLSRGLAAAHRLGILHRDLKPANAILAATGDVKLLDFGLAKLVDRTAAVDWSADTAPPPVDPAVVASAATLPPDAKTPPFVGARFAEPPVPQGPAATAIIGTPHYMAPEIWRGESATTASDVYAMGALLYELLTGKPPFSHVPPRELARRLQTEDPPRIAARASGIDARLCVIVDQCLARDPKQRFAAGDKLRDALEDLDRRVSGIAIPEGNPYRGLAPFEAEHRALYFGRTTETRDIVERLRLEPFVLVAGDSGVGKSSLCRAGVLPLVEQGALGGGRTWQTLVLTPGRRPLLSLSVALAPLLGEDEHRLAETIRDETTAVGREIHRRARDETGLCVFIDQLEQLVTLADPEEARQVAELLGRLAIPTPGVRLLASARGDFLTRLAALPGLGPAVSPALSFLVPLGADGIREAVTGPALATGVGFESEDLVDALAGAAASARSGLPLLQFTLAALWNARDTERNVITGAALEEMGGVRGALARHADAVVGNMLPAQRAEAKRILTRMVTADSTGARRTEAELVEGRTEAARTALEALVRGRLLVARQAEEGAVFELAHEALLASWGTLRGWLEKEAGGRIVHERLRAAASEWQRVGKQADVLWGARALGELKTIDLAGLSAAETDFVRRSRRAVQGRRATLVALGIGMLSTVGLVYGYGRAKLFRQVEGHVTAATGLYATARQDDDEVGKLRARAFELYDHRQREQGEAVWKEVRAKTDTTDRGYAGAIQELAAGHELNPERKDVSERLWQALYDRALFLERDRRPKEQVDEIVERIPVDDPLRRRWNAPGVVTIETAPAGAEVSLERYQAIPRGPRKLVWTRALGKTPIVDREIEQGSYVIVLSAPDRTTVRYPVVVGRAERLPIRIELPLASAVPTGFVYIPPGRFLFGSTELQRRHFGTVPLHEMRTGAYLFAQNETTFGEWIAFLDALPTDERVRRTPSAAGFGRGSLQLARKNGEWELAFQPGSRAYRARAGEKVVYAARDRRRVQDWLRFPVLGVSMEDARAYAAWLADSGRVPGARVCSELEWERAARGADDRELPSADELEPDDANFDETYGGDAAAFGPDEVGSHPASRSPFGIDDLAGNAIEWTHSALAANDYVQRGGTFFGDVEVSRATNRSDLPDPTLRDITQGIRLCATP